jgi:uncharacterized protein (DUF433 family)
LLHNLEGELSALSRPLRDKLTVPLGDRAVDRALERQVQKCHKSSPDKERIMRNTALLTPNEVAALADTSKTVVEKALEQKALSLPRGGRANRRLLPLHAVALAVAFKSLGRRLTVSDKRLVARELAGLSTEALKKAEIEVAPSVFVHVGALTRSAVERAERYAKARDQFIESVDGVAGGRPVIKGTRLTVSAIYGRMSSGDSIDELVLDYPDIPRDAFEAAFLYVETHPQVGRPVMRRTGQAA